MKNTKFSSIQFRGRDSIEFDMKFRSDINFVVPEPSLDFTEIYGRSASIITSNEKYNDIDKVFTARIYKNRDKSYATQLREIAVWLYLAQDYAPLVFSRHSDYYYKALGYKGASAPDKADIWLDVDVTFKCQPFVFRLDGEDVRDVISGEGITNPESFVSFPLISFNKTTAAADSNIYINGRQFRIAKEAGTGIITIDSENGIAYKAGGVNVSKQCFMANGKYEPIILEPGRNEISYNNINQFKIKPRWRNLAI